MYEAVYGLSTFLLPIDSKFHLFLEALLRSGEMERARILPGEGIFSPL